jgi:hypothetical protein
VFPLPGALLGLIGPLHRGVLVPRSAAASSIPAETHERLASRQPHAMAVAGSSRSAPRFYRTARGKCQTSAGQQVGPARVVARSGGPLGAACPRGTRGSGSIGQEVAGYAWGRVRRPGRHLSRWLFHPWERVSSQEVAGRPAGTGSGEAHRGPSRATLRRTIARGERALLHCPDPRRRERPNQRPRAVRRE